MPYFFRNCSADEIHLISQGQMTYETDFGNIEVGEREFLLIPKGVTYRVLMKSQESLRIIYESGPEVFWCRRRLSITITAREDRL